MISAAQYRYLKLTYELVQFIKAWQEVATREIEVIGNQLISYIDNRDYQRITLLGYDNGSVAIGLRGCHAAVPELSSKGIFSGGVGV